LLFSPVTFLPFTFSPVIFLSAIVLPMTFSPFTVLPITFSPITVLPSAFPQLNKNLLPVNIYIFYWTFHGGLFNGFLSQKIN
jgi:hypothetical protein